MAKGKYKRKRARAIQREQEQVQATIPLNGGRIGENAGAGKSARHTTKERVMPFREKVKDKFERSSLTDWIIAIFTGALAFTAIYQFIITDRQLDTMRKDQRPWIRVSFTPNELQALAPVGGIIHIVNNGKTPARGVIRGDFVVETVKNGEQPKLEYPLPHTRFTTGMIMPNDVPADITVERTRSGPNNSVESDPLIASELDDFKQVKIFFVIYGTIHYADFFGTDHWTKFCNVILPQNPPPKSTMTGQPCTNYADVDSN